MATISGIGFNTGDANGDLARLTAQLDRFAQMGCEMVEITATGLDAVCACRLIPERVAAVRKILARYPFTYSMHAPIAINLMDEPHLALHRRAAEASLELAAALGATTVVLHPGRVHPQLWASDADRLLGLECDVLGEAGERAAALGLVIAYENISPNPRVVAGLETSYSLDPRQLSDQLKRLSHPAVLACLDVSHAQQGAVLWEFDMVDACAALSPFIAHIHFSDSTGVPATMTTKALGELHFFGAGDMHAPAGWGAIDFDRLAAALRVREGTRIVIELKSNFHHHGAEPTLAAARRFAARLDGADVAVAAE